MSAGIKASQNPAEASRNARRIAALLLLAAGLPILGRAQTATTTTLAVTSNALSVSSVDGGAVVSLTATVEAGGKPVTPGQVNFCDATARLCSDIHLLGTAPVSSAGVAAIKLVPRPGIHSYKAEFAGTLTYAASNSTAQPLTVYGVPKTTLASSGSAGNYNLSATVTGSASNEAPAGNVEFKDTSNSNAVLATAALGTGTSALTWVNTQTPATPVQPLSILTADFNGDGIPDLAIGTNGIATGTGGTVTGYLSILLGNGDGTFQAAKTFPGLPNNQAIAVAPFVNGGPLDILTVDNNTTGTNNAAVFISNGAGGGTLGAPFSLGGLANVTAVATGDFNRDGSEDFVVTGLIYGEYCFAPVLGTGKGTFGAPVLNAVGNNPLLVAVGPFGTKGYPDIVVTDTGIGQVTIFENNSQGYFFPEGQANTGTNPSAMAVGDFNGDGYLDLAVVNSGSNNVTILLGNGNYTLTPATASPATGHSPTSIAVGDFNGDGIADLAVVNSGDKTISILLGKGDGTFTAGGTVGTGSNPVNLVAGDFSGSGLADLVVTNQDTASITGSTLTVQAAELTQTAIATATKVAPSGSGTHLVEASYVGDSLYAPSVSTTISLTGTVLPIAATPLLSPAGGTYTSAQNVILQDGTAGATIYYTLNGTTPTTASTKYTAAIAVSASETIEAIAVATGYTNSAVASAKYVIETPAATPTFSVAAGTYTAAQSVTLKSTTTGATIYYTLNGTTPTTASTKYTAAIAVSASETIEAIAVATGYTNSAVASAAYTIGSPIATFVATSSGTSVLTVAVGGSGAFSVASKNQSGQSYPSITVKTSTGPNPTLPVQVTLCQTNPSTGQCLAAPAPTVTIAPFANGATPSFSVFVTATAAIASSPSNQIDVLFANPSGTDLGSASVTVVTN